MKKRKFILQKFISISSRFQQSNSVRAVTLLSHCERPMVCLAVTGSPQPLPFPCILAPSIDSFQYCRDETAEFRATPLTTINFFSSAANQTTNVERRLHGVAKETQRHYYTRYQTTRAPEAVHRHYSSLVLGLSGREKEERRERGEKEVHVRDHD